MNESKKGNKFGLGIILAFIILIIVGGVLFFISHLKNTDDMAKAMERASKDYFNNYMSVNSGANAYKVTLGMLKEAKENGANYEIDVLDKCDDDKTYAMVSFDFSSGNAKDAEIVLNCKKF